jgi:hypothetical protein
MSELVLTESEESVIKKGFNFAVANRVSNLDMTFAAESKRSKFLSALIMEILEDFIYH